MTATTARRPLLVLAALGTLCSCGGGSGGSAQVAFVVNKTSGHVVACTLTRQGTVDLTRCRSASDVQFVEPIELVIDGTSAFISVQDGIERCTLRANQLVSCTLAISDDEFPVGLTLDNQSLVVADYSAKAIASYDLATLERIGDKAIPTAPTDVVFDQGFGFIVTQEIAGSVVLACNADLDNCSAVYSTLQGALLGMTIYNGVAFITDASDNNVVSCAVNADGTFSGCAVQGDATLFNYPYGITIAGNMAYVPNRAEASITVCAVDGQNLSNCAKIGNALFDGPTWVTIAPH